jgi:type III secretion system YscQ/HrcQ family protein
MITKLNLDQFLEPFKESVKTSLCLPLDVSHDDFLKLAVDFFGQDVQELTFHETKPVSHLPKDVTLMASIADPIAHPFYICFSKPANAKLFDLFFGSVDPFQDERLSLGASSYLLTSFLASLNQSKIFEDLAFYISETHASQDVFHHVKVEMKLQGSYPLVIDLYFPEAFVEAYLDKYKDKLSSHKQTHIELNVAVVTGLVNVTNSQLARLNPSSVIILDENYYDVSSEKGMAKLCAKGKNFAQARINHNHLKFLEFNSFEHETTMDNTSESPLLPLDEVQMQLQVEFASFKMSLKDLESLSVGQTIDLHKDHPTSVYLTLNGQKVARGELVKVGEAMAVMIEEMGHG